MDYRVAGMFTQVGPLYYVHHIWAYKSLADRKSSREQMWNKPGIYLFEICYFFYILIIFTIFANTHRMG